MSNLYKPTSKCPDCGRPPNVRFAEQRVLQARKERQATREQTHKCTNPNCGTVYWIRTGEIASATLDPSALESRVERKAPRRKLDRSKAVA